MIALLPLLLPLAPFVATTPQSFAYLLGLLAIVFALATEDTRASSTVAVLLAIWSVATHPLAGVIFFLTVILALWLKHQQTRNRNFFRSPVTWLFLVMEIVAVPLAFFINGLRSHATVTWNLSRFLDTTKLWTVFHTLLIFPTNHAALWADWAAMVGFLLPIVLTVGAIIACMRDKERRSAWLLFIVLAAGALLAGFFLRMAGDFSFLIDYERTSFDDRIFTMAELLLLIPALAGFAVYFENFFQRRNAFHLIAILLFLEAWQGAQAYLALPRHDATVVGHGWSVGSADQEAVRWIDQNADGQPYTALANQSTGAAAIEAFGFKRYATDIFYYSIPTGGPLYQLYLRVTREPSHALMEEAARLGKSDLVYVVLNEYWWDAEHVAARLSLLADQTHETQNGKVKIYKFNLR